MCNRIQLNTTYQNHHHIYVGYGLENEIKKYLSQNFGSKKAVFIVDKNVLGLYGETFIKEVSGLFDDSILISVPQGEQSKSITLFTEIISTILESKVERGTPVLVIGGGVTGDLGGFVASVVLRGLPLVHIPTTLLAMVDSSIGGKTGVNHSVGKNLIGAFYEPKAVFSDLKFLETLRQKEIINGLGEVIKYGMIQDESIFSNLESLSVSEKFIYSKEWEQLVTKCAKIKSDIVSEDFKESGLREVLNFGHTFAHVIERVRGYKNSSHGEAVYMGMWGAVKLSNLLGFNIDITNLSAFRTLYTTSFNPEETEEELANLMLYDKKVKDGSIRVIILEEKEKVRSEVVNDLSLIKESWKYIIQEFK